MARRNLLWWLCVLTVCLGNVAMAQYTWQGSYSTLGRSGAVGVLSENNFVNSNTDVGSIVRWYDGVSSPPVTQWVNPLNPTDTFTIGAGTTTGPRGIAMDSRGYVYVSAYDAGKTERDILVFNSDLSSTSSRLILDVSASTDYRVYGIDLDGLDRLYVLYYALAHGVDRVKVFPSVSAWTSDHHSTPLCTISYDLAAAAAHEGICVNRDGSVIWTTERLQRRAHRFVGTPTSGYTEDAGFTVDLTDAPGGWEGFKGIDINSDETKLYICDDTDGAEMVRIFDPATGVELGSRSFSTTGQARTNPFDLELDENENLYVAQYSENALEKYAFGTVVLEERFTSGTLDNEWQPFDTLGGGGEYNDNLAVAPASEVPGGAAPPGNASGYVGRIRDDDNNYMGIAGAYATATAGLTDIVYDAWVYCYDSLVNGAYAQGGIVSRLGGPSAYQRFFAYLGNDVLKAQTYDGTWDTHSWEGRTETAGWHKMKMRVEGDKVTAWFDDMKYPLEGCPVTMPALASSLTQGYAGVQVLHYLAAPPVGVYLDQIRVRDIYVAPSPTPTETATPTPTPISSITETPTPTPTPEPNPDVEFRALWVTRWDYVTTGDVDLIISNAAEYHFNVLLFQCRGNATTFYLSAYEPWAWELTGSDPSTLGTDPGWNPLARAVQKAHERDLQLHAYVNIFPAWRQTVPPPVSVNQLWNTHNEWFMCDINGNVMWPQGWWDYWYTFIDPCIPGVQDHLNNVFVELMQNYALDGLHYDYIRYPSEVGNWSYNPISVARFQAHYGGTPQELPTEWAQWKRDGVTDFVERTCSSATLVRPSIITSAAVNSSYSSGYNSYFQDGRGWLQLGIMDCTMPMIYTSNMTTFTNSAQQHIENAYGRYSFPGISADSNSAAGVVQQIGISRSLGAKGTAIFAYSSFFPGHVPNSKADALLTGPYSNVASVPPFPWKTTTRVTNWRLY